MLCLDKRVLSEMNLGVKCRPEGFWSAVDVWIKKPHVVNKRLCGATETEYRDVSSEELEPCLCSLTGVNLRALPGVLSFLHAHTVTTDHQTWSVGERTIIPKVGLQSNGPKMYKEIIVKDLAGQTVTFLPTEENSEGQIIMKDNNIYQIQLQEKTDDWILSLHVLRPDQWYSDGVAYPKLTWLTSELLPKLARWATDSKATEFKSTLSLISVEKYSLVYQQLKNKYKEIVKVWPEVTDPEKFVFEDVAIATYLLVLWAEERAERGITSNQSFVDLGCGNGLLVHILNNEGHPGKGIDIRKRKIWDMYGPNTHLEEKAITPSAQFLFPETDWLIGNHSDELTPWIPVIAARSSYHCRYFVLPCCFFDFCGKYQRRQCKKSQYREYIDFISEVSTSCGFQTDEDCLRIPSTKRVCLIGKSRSYEQVEEEFADVKRTDYISGRQALISTVVGQKIHSGSHHHGDGQEMAKAACDWGKGFQPREKIETVRNCAALPRDFVDGVVLKVAMALLGLAGGKTEEEEEDKIGKERIRWNAGGSLSVREVAELLDKSTLQTLKKECGGLQTLLKNNHQVFRVEGGQVHIRDWLTQASQTDLKHKSQISGALKTRLCWFHTHHPDGCPLSSKNCVFAHGADDLRPSTRPLKKHRS
ncbi:probable tRNA (uracil-O(2)-)-methyltransferase [Tachysurus fulvidraco]|uniref:probable tRNA (uracil-O(2)-)-methyltransferase n=1 Tax=Tachysurus fulvidraco TaxID=1234273 RepID=UPI001FED9142|nr:probable tRNA (uracil-O(2)-)-methyltransferase [Tachysurus fulvidraco]